MLKAIANSWKTLIFKGILLILFAIFAFANPTATAASIVIWIAALIIIDGVMTIIAGFKQWSDKENRWPLLLEGILGLIFGLVLLFTPGITLAFIGIMLGLWFILVGVTRIYSGIKLRNEIEGEGWLIFNGVLALLLGGVIVARPFLGISSFMWLIGLACLLIGIALITLGLKFRKGKNTITERFEEMKDDFKSNLSDT